MSTAFDIRPSSEAVHPPKHKPRETRSGTPAPATGPKLSYYDYGPVLSRNAVFNFIIGGRGLGKTYGAKKLALDRWFKKGDQFIYLRRYTDELKDRDKFFADIEELYPQWDFRANGNTFEVAPASTRDEKGRQWEEIGFAIALSTGQKKKSVAFPRVKLIIFDEFIIEKGVLQYLPNEADVFNNLYSTVDRWKDKTTVLFLANSASLKNPYILRYRLAPDTDGSTEWVVRDKGFLVCHYPNSADFQREVMATRFGRFIEGTEYAEYAVGNKFKDNRSELVAQKSPRAKHLMNLETRLGWLSVWCDIHTNKYWAYSMQPTGARAYTLIPESVTPDRMLLLYNDNLITRLKYEYRVGNVHFDESLTQITFMDLFTRR